MASQPRNNASSRAKGVGKNWLKQCVREHRDPDRRNKAESSEVLYEYISILLYVLQVARLSLEHEHSQQQRSDADERPNIPHETSSGKPPKHMALFGHSHVQTPARGQQ